MFIADVTFIHFRYDVMKQCWLEPHARPPMCDVTAALLNLTAVSWNSGENVTQADVTPTKGTSSLVPVKETSILNNYNKTADNLIETNDRQHEKSEPFSNTSAPSSRATISSFVGKNVVDISELNSEPNDIKNPHSPPVAIVRPLQLDRQGICSTSGFGSNIPPSPSNTKHDTENYIEETSTSTNLSECVCNPVDDVAYTPPPVTYIGDPTDSIELFRSRAHSDTAVSRLQRPLTRSQSTDSTTSQDSVSSTGSEYVMLPGETTRRRSSFRQANYQVCVGAVRNSSRRLISFWWNTCRRMPEVLWTVLLINGRFDPKLQVRSSSLTVSFYFPTCTPFILDPLQGPFGLHIYQIRAGGAGGRETMHPPPPLLFPNF